MKQTFSWIKFFVCFSEKEGQLFGFELNRQAQKDWQGATWKACEVSITSLFLLL